MEENTPDMVNLAMVDELQSVINKNEEKEKITKESRFSEAIWMKQIPNYRSIIGGAGNIGSWLALYLGRIGLNLTIFDHDIVEIQNVGGQLYSEQDIGSFKVHALQNILLYLGAFPYNSCTYNYKISSNTISNSSRINGNTILYSCFDNIQARKDVFNAFKNLYEVKLLIDGRSQAEYYQILVVDKNKPESIERYEKEFLFSDEEAADAPCNFKSTTHCGSQLATMITALTTNYLGNLEIGEEVNVIPFFTQVNLLNMNFSMQYT